MILLSSKDKLPPCGVPTSVGSYWPWFMTPAFRYIRIRLSVSSSCRLVRYSRYSVSFQSFPTYSVSFPLPNTFYLPMSFVLPLKYASVSHTVGLLFGTYISIRHFELFDPSRFLGTMVSADFSQFVVTTDSSVRETSRDKPLLFPQARNLLGSSCSVYAIGLRLPFGLRCLRPTYPPIAPSYRVPVRQATISLSLLSAYTSRRKPWESLSGWSVTTSRWTFITEH